MTATILVGPRHAARYLAIAASMLAGCAQQPVSELPRAQKSPPRWTYTTESPDTWGHTEREEEMALTIAPFNPLTGAGPADQIKAKFRGKHRKYSKTHISDSDIESFDDLEALLETLPSEDDMRDHDPEITKDLNSHRATEENRNVSVPTFICAIKYEADQDWHIIGAAENDCDTGPFFNYEISGLPGNNAFAFDTLLEVRNSFAGILDNDLPGPGSYRKFENTPIPVIIEGSLFYDIDHSPGVVGPDGMRPNTSWEIHPVTQIDLVEQ